MSEISNDIVESAKNVSVEVYKDAAQPIVKPIGEILGFLPRTIKLALSGWEKWLINGEESLRLTAEAIKEKAKAIPEEKLVEPEPYVAIPAVQQISYCQNSSDLREMYASLIAASMNADTKWKVHPSFVDIIKQLNPDEARYIKKLVPNLLNFYPLIDVQLHYNGRNGYNTLVSNFTNSHIEVLEHPENICSYIVNLERLKIIDIPPTIHLTDENIYKSLENHKLLHIPFLDNQEGVKITYKHKCFGLTPFGLDLLRVIK